MRIRMRMHACTSTYPIVARTMLQSVDERDRIAATDTVIDLRRDRSFGLHMPVRIACSLVGRRIAVCCRITLVWQSLEALDDVV